MYKQSHFTPEQWSAIKKGIKYKLHPKYYVKTNLNPDQMLLIQEGLIRKIDISKYAKSTISADNMESIIEDMIDGISDEFVEKVINAPVLQDYTVWIGEKI